MNASALIPRLAFLNHRPPFLSLKEEIANAILHGVGALVAAAGSVPLVLRAAGLLGGRGGGIVAAVSYAVYCLTMTGMFLASTIYHAVQNRKTKRVLRILDHSAVYLFIAGSYTPLCLVAMKGVLGITILAIEWSLALTILVFYSIGWIFIKKAELLICLPMGWGIVLALIPLSKLLPFISLMLIFGGGAVYSIGTLWFRLHNKRGAHVIWHVFVLGGALCHYWAIWFMS
jgi:hemolysin III